MRTPTRASLVTIVKGKGSLVWDDTGKEYIDLSTGIAVDIFGVADEEWVAAVTKQLGTLQHISNLYYTEPIVPSLHNALRKDRHEEGLLRQFRRGGK